MMDDPSNLAMGPFRREELGAFQCMGSIDVLGRAEVGRLLQEQYRHTGDLEPVQSNGCFKSSHEVIFPRGYQLIPQEEGIIGKEYDVSECGWSSVASKIPM